MANAFKFTEAGSVEVRMSVEHDTSRLHGQALRQAPAALALAITDTGIGIAEGKQQLVFDAFQQGDAALSRAYGGTGLGLTISRDLARVLGGEIHLQSEIGRGSTFTLYLPIAPAGDARPPAPPPEEKENETERGRAGAPHLQGKRILVVDDDVRNLFAVASVLEQERAKVLTASDAAEAFEALEKNPDVDLVLMDMMMPKMDGYEATRRLRGDPRHAGLPPRSRWGGSP